MNRWVILTLRAVIGVALVGSVVVQAALVAGLRDEHPALAVIGVLWIVAVQVVALCIWQLLTMAHLGTVFSHAAFRYVDVVIGAVLAASVLTLSVAVVARQANRSVPGDEVAPGVVGLICGLALVIGGVALVVYVMRTLLAQAVALDSEAKHLKSELDEVI